MARHIDSRSDGSAGLTRRRVLQQAGFAIAASTLPASALPAGRPVEAAAAQAPTPAATAADIPVSEVMTTLSTYMAGARQRALPDEIMERAKRHILDSFAAMVSGSELEPGQRALAFARAYGGSAVATVVADKVVCGPIEAAMVNGTMAHADETDDTLAPGPWHPGCNVVPAALALGEQFRTPGAEFVRAVVLGYDIGTRVMAAIAPGNDGQKLTYGIAGTFGAAAAGGSVAGFDARKMRFVLSYAAQQASGIESFPRDPDHTEKGFIFGGMPARSGVTATLLVHHGWTAVDDIMSGPHNFITGHAPTGNPRLLVERLGDLYQVTRANIKRWTVGFPIHAPLDAVEEMFKKGPIDPQRIREVIVRYPPASITDNSAAVDINVQHALAVMLVDGKLTFKSIHDIARMKDPVVLALKQKIRLDPGPANATAANRPPLVQIVMTDGSRLSQDNVGPAVLGTAGNPLSREQLLAKCRELMSPVLGAQQTARLIERVMTLETVTDVRTLRPLLQATRRNGPPRLSDYPG